MGVFNYEGINDNEVKLVSYEGSDTEKIEIPSNVNGKRVTVIGKMAFYKHTEIKAVYMPDSIVEVEDCAFKFCNTINELRLSNSLNKIGIGAFSECYDIDELILPESLVNVAYDSFWGSISNTIKFPVTWTEINNGYFSARNLVIPGHIKKLGYNAISGNDRVAKLIISEGVEEIAGLNHYHSITELILPKSLKKMPTLHYNYALKELVIPENITSLPNNMVIECKNLKKIVVPETVTQICDNTFITCDAVLYVKEGSCAHQHAIAAGIDFFIVDDNGNVREGIVPEDKQEAFNLAKDNRRTHRTYEGIGDIEYSFSEKIWLGTLNMPLFQNIASFKLRLSANGIVMKQEIIDNLLSIMKLNEETHYIEKALYHRYKLVKKDVPEIIDDEFLDKMAGIQCMEDIAPFVKAISVTSGLEGETKFMFKVSWDSESVVTVPLKGTEINMRLVENTFEYANEFRTPVMLSRDEIFGALCTDTPRAFDYCDWYSKPKKIPLFGKAMPAVFSLSCSGSRCVDVHRDIYTAFIEKNNVTHELEKNVLKWYTDEILNGTQEATDSWTYPEIKDFEDFGKYTRIKKIKIEVDSDDPYSRMIVELTGKWLKSYDLAVEIIDNEITRVDIASNM